MVLGSHAASDVLSSTFKVHFAFIMVDRETWCSVTMLLLGKSPPSAYGHQIIAFSMAHMKVACATLALLGVHHSKAVPHCLWVAWLWHSIPLVRRSNKLIYHMFGWQVGVEQRFFFGFWVWGWGGDRFFWISNLEAVIWEYKAGWLQHALC
jgi:hypothetical protein